MSEVRQYTSQNRSAWNEIANERSVIFPDAAFFSKGGSTLAERDVQAAGDVKGRKLLHLQCATGEDTLSWAVQGACASGVDISEKQIVIAQQKALSAGLEVQFVAADIYALPADLQQASFDFVYTGGGALCWLPDIQEWARVVCAALRPGGRLILSEEHPIASCLHVQDGKIVVEDQYFRRSTPWLGSGWRHFSGGAEAKETKAEFQWPLGDVVTAFALAGLSTVSLEEFPVAAGWRFGKNPPEGAASLPGKFLLVASKR